MFDLDIVKAGREEETTADGSWQIDASDVYTTWAVEAEKRDVVFWERMLVKLNENNRCGKYPLKAHEILVVGDEYTA